MSSGLKSKKCDFCFALSDMNQCDRIISELYDFPIWAYIRHFPDDEDGHEHYHFYIHLNQPITIHNLAEKLDIPDNMIEWVRNKTKFIQYMIHKNEENKIHYSDSDIFTNNREYISVFLYPESNNVSVSDEFKSLSDVASGRITPYAYITDNLNSLSSLSFYSRQLFLIRLIQLSMKGEESYYDRSRIR